MTEKEPSPGGKPATTSPTVAVIGKLEQTNGKVLTISGLFDDLFSRMALEKGFFRDVGLQVEFTGVASGPAIRAALLAGETDIAEVATALIMAPIEQGVAVRIIGVPKPKQNQLFYSRKEFNSLTDLYGKNIGAGPPGGVVYGLVQALFDKYGADINKTNVINLETSTAIGQALLAGKVDAGPSGIDLLPQIESSREFKVLYNLPAEFPEFTRQIIAATDRTIREKPNVLAAMLTAYSRGLRHAIENRQESIDLAKKLFPGAQSVESTFDWYVKNRIVDPNLEFAPEVYARFQRFMVKLGLQSKEIPYEQAVDSSAQKKMISLLGPYTYKP